MGKFLSKSERLRNIAWQIEKRDNERGIGTTVNGYNGETLFLSNELRRIAEELEE